MAGGNPILEAAAAGRPTFGPWCSTSGPIGAEILGRAGFDWVLVDLQHGGTTLASLLTMLQAVEAGGGTPVVRVGANDPRLIMRVLDLGARTVIVPLVDTPEDARRAAEAMRYPPHGTRSFGPVRGAYLEVGAADAEVACIVMIETQEGLENADAIAAVDGVDGLFIGPIDLGLALGEGLDFTGMRPSLQSGADRVIEAARKHGKLPGSVALTPAHGEDLLRRGMAFLAFGADGMFLSAGAAGAVEAIATLKDGVLATTDAGDGRR